MNERINYLTCKKVKFYSRKDEDALFEWISKIECIKKIDLVNNELYMYLASNSLHEYDLRDLLSLLYRYKIDMKQLAQFLTPENKHWFYDNKKAYWFRRVFGNKN